MKTWGVAAIMIGWVAWLAFLLWIMSLPMPARAETGMASYYACHGDRENGRGTASGARMNGDAMTAAHRRLPFGSVVTVTRVTPGHAMSRSVRVTITDRGPAKRTHRVIDLSCAAARQLGMLRVGVARVSF